MNSRSALIIAAVALLAIAVLYFSYSVLFGTAAVDPHEWSEAELDVLATLSLSSLPPLEPDPSNRVGDDENAAALGHALFFDTRLSGDGSVSCASCHQPDLYFTDGRPRANVRDIDTERHTPTIVGLGYSDWFYWDGRKDSQWAQALSPVEAPREHAGNRAQYVRLIADFYREPYEAVFGPLPDLSDVARFPPSAGPVDNEKAAAAWEALAPEDRDEINQIFANVGKAIAAYERQILPAPLPHDLYIDAALAGDREMMEASLSDAEAVGLRLFITEGRCLQCHNGPLLSNGTFHNLGLPLDADGQLDPGRIVGATTVLEDTFNCLGPFSDADPNQCDELRFVKTEGDELVGAFKTPSLRGVADTAPYMHNGILPTLDAVLAHYSAAPPAFPGHSDLEPLDFEAEELAALKAFLETLTGEVDASDALLGPPDS